MRWIKSRVIQNIKNLLGWSTSRRIVVIESDDWGTIRMSSKDAFSFFLKRGYRVDDCVYNRNDALESNSDMEGLFDVLLKFKDQHGNHPVVTANMLVANPAFARIRESGYTRYFYEPFTETLAGYPNRDKVFEYYKKGIDFGIFRPQFHGREHVNIRKWLGALRSGELPIKEAFDRCMFTLHVKGTPSGRGEFLDSFGGSSSEEHTSYCDIIKDGLELFEKLCGYRSRTFIAPCYIWPKEIEPILCRLGVDYIQGDYVQRVPKNDLDILKKYHFMGQRNSYGQRYLVRNAFFEPSAENGSLDTCLRQISLAFRWNKPAIISSHRVNYIGTIREINRSQNLALLEKLFAEVLKRWPNTEFMSSDQFALLMEGDVSNDEMISYGEHTSIHRRSTKRQEV